MKAAVAEGGDFIKALVRNVFPLRLGATITICNQCIIHPRNYDKMPLYVKHEDGEVLGSNMK